MSNPRAFLGSTRRHVLAATLIGASSLVGLTGTASAQTSLTPSENVSEQNKMPPLPKPEALLPGLFGLRPWLTDHGIAVLLDNRDEFSGIISGPRQGATNSGQYSFETDIDWQRLAGLTGFSTHTVIVGRYGIPASRIFGDQINPSQEIYGAGGNTAAHLVYAFGEETLAGGRVDVAAGWMPLLNDFLASPLYCNYENNAFCGNPKESSNNFALSSYPDAGWAIRGRVRPIASVYIQSGIYFSQSNIYNYAENYRSGFTIDSSYINGEAFPIEAGWEPSFGSDHLPGHYKIGFVYDNNNHPSTYFDANGAPYALSGLSPKEVKGSTTSYVLADQMLMRNGPGQTDGLIALGGFVHNDPNVLNEENQFEAGLIDTGFWKARPLDTVAIGFDYQTISGGSTKTEELEEELGTLPAPPPGEVPSYKPYTVTGLQSHAFVIEANYQIHVFRGVTFAPDFQYFIRPNAQTNLPDAAILGFWSHVELF